MTKQNLGRGLGIICFSLLLSLISKLWQFEPSNNHIMEGAEMTLAVMTVAGYLRKKLISFYCGQERKWGCSITYHRYSGLTDASCGTLVWRQRACQGPSQHCPSTAFHICRENKSIPASGQTRPPWRNMSHWAVTYSEGIQPTATTSRNFKPMWLFWEASMFEAVYFTEFIVWLTM